MLRTIFIILIFLSFFALGAVAPFILTLSYIWVDTFRPQDVAWFVMDQLPVAQLTGVAAVAGYVLLDRGHRLGSRSPRSLSCCSPHG